MAAVRIPGRISVVFEDEHVASNRLSLETLFGNYCEAFNDAFTTTIVSYRLDERITFWSRIFGMRTNIEIQPPAIWQEGI